MNHCRALTAILCGALLYCCIALCCVKSFAVFYCTVMCEPLLCCAVWSFLLCCAVGWSLTLLCSALLRSALLCSALLCSVETFAEVFFWLALCFALCCCVVLWTVLCCIMLRCRLLSKASSLKNLWVSSQPQLFSFVFIKTPSPGQVKPLSKMFASC